MIVLLFINQWLTGALSCLKVRQNVLDMTLHISQYSNIIAELREEIRRLKQKLDQQGQAQKNTATLHAIQSMSSFIHSDHFYSSSSSPLLLRSAPDTARIPCQSFTPYVLPYMMGNWHGFHSVAL